MNEETKQAIIFHARERGDRVIIDGKTKWPGLGNRSGLHDYANTAINEKWAKSGARFEKMLDTLPDKTRIDIKEFRNINRDRGLWQLTRTFVINN